MKRTFLLAVAFVAFSLPAQVLACPVCSPGRDDATRKAFFDTTIFLSLLPLAMFGGLVYWFFRRTQQLDEHHDSPRELAPSAEE